MTHANVAALPTDPEGKRGSKILVNTCGKKVVKGHRRNRGHNFPKTGKSFQNSALKFSQESYVFLLLGEDYRNRLSFGGYRKVLDRGAGRGIMGSTPHTRTSLGNTERIACHRLS